MLHKKTILIPESLRGLSFCSVLSNIHALAAKSSFYILAKHSIDCVILMSKKVHIFKLQIYTAMSWSTYAQLKRPRQQVVVGITSSLVRALHLDLMLSPD